jgi:hypothetical protein
MTFPPGKPQGSQHTMTLDPAIADMARRRKESAIPGLHEGSGPEILERARNATSVRRST